MKKTLVAIAALAAFGAQAQSSVTIDGGFDAGYQAINYKGNKVSGIDGNGSSTSQLNFRGVEDLGGGLKADFRLESDFSVVSKNLNTGVASGINQKSGDEAKSTNSIASTWGNGEARVGINGGFGRVDLGAVNFNGITTTGTGQPFGTAVGSAYKGIYRVDTLASQIRDENAAKFTTPTFMGLTGTLYKSNKQTKAANNTTANSSGLYTANQLLVGGNGTYDKVGSTEFGLNYANGPVAASYSQLTQDFKDAGSGLAEIKLKTLGANYTMGAAKLFALYQTNKSNTAVTSTSGSDIDTSATMLSATYTMGKTVLMAGTGSIKANAGSVQAYGVSGQKSKLNSLGADYNLSKTAALYVRYESFKDDAKILAAAASIDGSDTKRTRTALGLRVAF